VPRWDVEALAEHCLAIQAIPAPSFAEHARAADFAGRLRACGLKPVEVDALPNVYARIPGRAAGPAVMVSAHLDTVFPAETDLTSRREGARLSGPGMGDNCMGTAGLLGLAKALVESEAKPDSDVWLVANAGEEGLGDLLGMRAAIDRLGEGLKACIVIEGSKHRQWPITHRALGSRRYRIGARAEGGHSWGNFGRSSAIHLLVGLAAEISAWEVPSAPRSSFNIGLIQGGTSVNTIAEEASFLLDLRSENGRQLERMARRAERLVADHDRLARRRGDASFVLESVGDRPAGSIPAGHRLVKAAHRALTDQGVPAEEIANRISSTDANIPLSRGIPAVTIHLTDGGNAHRMDEWISLDALEVGMTQLWNLTFAAAALPKDGGT
jgi:acetylornithine deacetylase/succinyl-diaminopimelate desuccinylase-like protein